MRHPRPHSRLVLLALTLAFAFIGAGSSTAAPTAKATRLPITTKVKHAVHNAFCISRRDRQAACHEPKFRFPLVGHQCPQRQDGSRVCANYPACYIRIRHTRWFQATQWSPTAETTDGVVLLRHKPARRWKVAATEDRVFTRYASIQQAMQAAGCFRQSRAGAARTRAGSHFQWSRRAPQQPPAKHFFLTKPHREDPVGYFWFNWDSIRRSVKPDKHGRYTYSVGFSISVNLYKQGFAIDSLDCALTTSGPLTYSAGGVANLWPAPSKKVAKADDKPPATFTLGAAWSGLGASITVPFPGADRFPYTPAGAVDVQAAPTERNQADWREQMQIKRTLATFRFFTVFKDRSKPLTASVMPDCQVWALHENSLGFKDWREGDGGFTSYPKW